MQIPGEFLLSSLRAAVDDDLQRPLGRASASHSWDVDVRVPERLHGDRERLHRVLVNLVEDAVQETAGGEVTVKIGRHYPPAPRGAGRIGPSAPVRSPHPQGAEQFRLELIIVADSPRELPRPLVTPFLSPVHAETLRTIAQMQGQVGWQKATGLLREFSFIVPVYAPSGLLLRASGQNLRRQQILLVDDDRLGRVLMAGLLRGQGYSVTEASSGIEALSKYRTQAFDAIVTDLRMPGLDGRGLAECIRASHPPDSPAVPAPYLIVVSASPGAELENIVRLQLFDHCLQKPVAFERLMAALEA